MVLSVGTTLQEGKYRLESILALSDIGATYLATHTSLNQSVVIKTYRPPAQETGQEPQAPSAFFANAHTLSRFHHPNLCRVFGFFQEQGVECMVSEFIHGKTFLELTRSHPFSESTAIQYIQQVALGLKTLHRHELIHLGLNPSHLMKRNHEDSAVAIGLNSVMREFSPQQIPEAYHPYLSPEQFISRKPASLSSEVYSLAATLYFMVTGQEPVSAIDRFQTQLPAPRQLCPHLSDRLEQAILRGMALDARDRPLFVSEWMGLLPNTAVKKADYPTTTLQLVHASNDHAQNAHAQSVYLQSVHPISGVNLPPLRSLTPEGLISAILVPEGLISENSTPENLIPETLISEELISETLAPEGLISENSTPENLIPETLIPETLIPEELISETLAPEGLISENSTPENLISETLIPEELIPENLISEELVSEELVSERLAPENVISEELVSENVISEKLAPAEELAPEYLVSEELNPENSIPENLIPEELSSKAASPPLQSISNGLAVDSDAIANPEDTFQTELVNSKEQIGEQIGEQMEAEASLDSACSSPLEPQRDSPAALMAEQSAPQVEPALLEPTASLAVPPVENLQKHISSDSSAMVAHSSVSHPRFPKWALFWCATVAACGGLGAGLWFRMKLAENRPFAPPNSVLQSPNSASKEELFLPTQTSVIPEQKLDENDSAVDPNASSNVDETALNNPTDRHSTDQNPADRNPTDSTDPAYRGDPVESPTLDAPRAVQRDPGVGPQNADSFSRENLERANRPWSSNSATSNAETSAPFNSDANAPWDVNPAPENLNPSQFQPEEVGTRWPTPETRWAPSETGAQPPTDQPI